MGSINKICPAIIFLLLLWSCKKDSTITKIDSDIIIRQEETVDSTARRFVLHCSTERTYETSSYGIDKTFSLSGKNIDIHFKGIIAPGIGLTSIGPARTTIDFGFLSIGTYDLTIKAGIKESKGQLLVTSDNYVIRLNPQDGIQIANSALNRIPANTIWGTVGYHVSSTAALVQTFIDSLQLLGATAQTYHAGDFGYFQINSSGEILPPQNHGYYFIRPYIFNYAANTSALKTLVKNYGAGYRDSLNITLYTTKGETFMSWIQ